MDPLEEDDELTAMLFRKLCEPEGSGNIKGEAIDLTASSKPSKVNAIDLTMDSDPEQVKELKKRKRYTAKKTQAANESPDLQSASTSKRSRLATIGQEPVNTCIKGADSEWDHQDDLLFLAPNDQAAARHYNQGRRATIEDVVVPPEYPVQSHTLSQVTTGLRSRIRIIHSLTRRTRPRRARATNASAPRPESQPRPASQHNLIQSFGGTQHNYSYVMEHLPRLMQQLNESRYNYLTFEDLLKSDGEQ